jgi:hypothetical protein
VPRRSSFVVFSLPFGLGGIEQTWEVTEVPVLTGRDAV